MAMVLRDYQDDLIDRTRVALRTNKRALMVAPTGAGKTAIAAQMLHTLTRKGKTGFFLCHRQEILDQSMEAFAQYEVPFGVISAGFTPDPRKPIQLCSIDTLRARISRGARVPVPDLLIIDEAHHSVAGGWALVKKYFAAAAQIGLTATPRRLDNRGLRDQFDVMVEGPTVAELIEGGFLSKYRPFIPSTADLSKVGTSMGDYIKSESVAAMDKPSITGDAISHYLRHARDKRALAFCVSIAHSKHVVDQFREAGVEAWHIDGDTNRGERREALLAFRRGEIKVISNVDLIAEGFNCPGAEVAILLRPTKSLALYRQQVGRCLRPADGKGAAVILDHSGNLMRHGFPDDDIEWSLDGEPKKKKAEAEVAVKTCPKCLFAHHAGRPRCPNCGFAYEKAGREVDQVEGVLDEVAGVDERRAEQLKLALEKKEQNRQARSIEELVELGRARGYAKPEKWAGHVLTARGIDQRQVSAMVERLLKERESAQ